MKIGKTIGGLSCICALTGALLAPTAAVASQDTNGVGIDQVDVEGIYFGVQVVETPNSPPSPACVSAGYTKYLKFDATTSQGRVWASILTAALLAGKQIGYIGSTTTCTGSTGKMAETLTQFWVYE